MAGYFEYRHIVGLEETNVTGNVYFANHIRWQGRCREMFLRTHAPGIFDQLRSELTLLTVRCSCDYLAELFAVDEIAVRLFLEDQVQNRVLLRFEYWRITTGVADPCDTKETLIARGMQEIACMKRSSAGIESTPVPRELLRALQPFRRVPHSSTSRQVKGTVGT